MSVPALWTQHRPIARGIARDYRIPGLEQQDVAQEALIALWVAARGFDPEKGAFPPFARTVIHRHLGTLLRAALREKRHAHTVPFDPDLHGRSDEPLIACQLPLFTARERAVMAAHVDGSYDWTDKRQENASQRALRKLRAR